MKKNLVAVGLLLLFMLFQRSAFAASGKVQTLNVNGATMTVTLPGGWDVITRDTAKGDPVLAKYSIDMDTLIRNYEAQGVIFCTDAINPGTQNEMLIGLMNDDSSAQIPNLSSLTDVQMDDMLNQTKPSLDLQSMDCSLFSWKIVGEYKYLYYEYGSKPIYAIQYTTTVNGYYVNIMLKNFRQTSLGKDEIAALTKTVESISFTGVTTAPVMLNAFGPVSQTAVIGGVVLVAFLILMLQLGRRKVITIPQTQYDKLNNVGGVLAWMGFRMIVGALVQLGSLSMAVIPLYTVLGIVSIALLVASFITMFIRNSTFVLMYIITVIYTIIVDILFMEYPIAISTGFVEMLFIIYLFSSVRVALLYKTKKVSIMYSPVTPALQAAGIPVSGGMYQVPVKRAVTSQEELRQVNPIAYKRNVVAIANGYRDFPDMILSNRSLDQNLMFAVREDELNKVAAAYGMRSFEEWYNACQRTIDAGADKGKL